jgi:hypothetical protein
LFNSKIKRKENKTMEEKKYRFEITENEANIVLAALSELPFKVSSQLIAKLQSQAQTQNKVEVVEKEKTAKKS